MARIFTPSERTRRNINPQPVTSSPDSILRAKSLVILKNIIGSPLPFLWICLIPSLFLGLDLHSGISMGILVLTSLYICLDIFSKSREFRFFRLGIEIPIFFLLMALLTNNWLNDQALFSGDFFYVLLWLLLVYALSYSLNLFPGLNRLFNIFIGAGIVYGAFSIWTSLQYQHWFWPLSYTEKISALANSSASLFPSVHLWICALLVIFSTVFFIYKKKLVSVSFLLVLSLFVLAVYNIIPIPLPLFYLAPLIPLFYFLFFISKHFARDCILFLIALVAIYSGFQSLEDSTKERFLPSESSTKLEREYWRQEFESLDQHLWFGKKSSTYILDPYRLHGKLSSEGRDSVKDIEVLKDQLFQLDSNLYLYLITQKGIFVFLFYMLCLLSMILMNLRLIQDVPFTHHWHKVYALSLLSFQIFFAIASMNANFWRSSQLSCLFAVICAILFYMSESYLRQIVPDDHSL